MEILHEELNTTVDPDLDTFIDKMNNMKKNLYGKVDENIQKSQKKQKKDYDQKHKHSTVIIFF